MLLAEVLTGNDMLVRSRLGLGALLDDPAARIPQFLALAYVPNAFDILPMYLAILALVPLMMAAAKRSLRLAVAVSLALWLLAELRVLSLPADLDSGRAWFFNPFGWQLLFFLGFGFARGWLKPPPATALWLGAAAAVVVLAAPVSCHAGWNCHAGWGVFPKLGEIHTALLPYADKTSLGPLRILHFLSLAFLAYTLAGEQGRRLTGPAADLTRLVGRQTLSAFLAGLWLAQVLGVALDLVGRDIWTTALANILGCAGLVLTAFVVERVKLTFGTKARSADNVRAAALSPAAGG
jgi:hypothetical protein